MISKRGKQIDNQARQVIYKVYEYMKNESELFRDRGPDKHYFSRVQLRTAEAVGSSLMSIRRIVADVKETGSVNKELKKRNEKKEHRLNLTDSDYAAIRVMIFDHQLTQNKTPTVTALWERLKTDITYKGSKESLRRILKEIGFEFRKTDKNKVILQESPAKFERMNYLREISKFRCERRHIVYCDMTNICQNIPGKNVKNKPYVQLFWAGNEFGCIMNSIEQNPDLSKDFTQANFERWLKNELMPNIPQHTTLIFNTTLHDEIDEVTPNENSKSSEIKEWLTQRNIKFNKNLSKQDMCEIIKQNGGKNHYKIDRIIMDAGHYLLRIPKFYPDFNPLQLLSKDLKENLTKLAKMSVEDLKISLISSINTMNQPTWLRAFEHVRKCEMFYVEYESWVGNSATGDRYIHMGVEESD